MSVNAMSDFNNIMRLIQQHPHAEESKYDAGIKQCQELEQTVETECESLEFNLEEMRKKAEDMKKAEGGDILPALNYLSKFTGAKDPRICGPEVKKDYLTGVLLFASIAREYLKMRIEERKYLAEKAIDKQK
jgi:hypothetical protein